MIADIRGRHPGGSANWSGKTAGVSKRDDFKNAVKLEVIVSSKLWADIQVCA